MRIYSTFKRQHQNNTEQSIITASGTAAIGASATPSGTASNYSTFKNIK